MNAYVDEETRRAMRAKYAGFTCGNCKMSEYIGFLWREDKEPLDRDATGATPSATLCRCYMWCNSFVGLVARSRPVYTDEDGVCPRWVKA